MLYAKLAFRNLKRSLQGYLSGCFLGVFVYELLHAMLLNIFGYGYAFQLAFSWQACGSTLLCFLGIYVLELLREGRALQKQSIHSMLYTERKNEKTVKGTRLSVFYFLVALILAVAGLLLTKQYDQQSGIFHTCVYAGGFLYRDFHLFVFLRDCSRPRCFSESS